MNRTGKLALTMVLYHLSMFKSKERHLSNPSVILTDTEIEHGEQYHGKSLARTTRSYISVTKSYRVDR